MLFSVFTLSLYYYGKAAKNDRKKNILIELRMINKYPNVNFSTTFCSTFFSLSVYMYVMVAAKMHTEIKMK